MIMGSRMTSKLESANQEIELFYSQVIDEGTALAVAAILEAVLIIWAFEAD